MKKAFKVLSIILIFTMVMVGCSNTNTPSESSAAPVEKATTQAKSNTSEADEFIPQIMFNGSSTLAPVIAKISTNFIEEYVTWDKVDASYPEENIAIYVSSGGSGQGVKSVIDGSSDFGMVARSIKDIEKEQMTNLKEFKVGIDALTLAVNPNNPVLTVKNNLTKEEIVKIFSGEYKTWKDLDSTLPEKEIVVVTRDIGGGAHEVFQSKIMGDVEVKADAIQAPSMGALVTKIIENEYAIGYASFGIVNQNKDKIVTLKVDDVDATIDNIVSGSYIIQRPLIAMINGELTAPQQSFIDYLMGEEGLSVVESMGFIPVK